MEKKKDYYVYVYLNQTKPGFWKYKNIEFKYQPFYIGKGRNKRESVHLCESMLKQHNHKNSIIKSIKNKINEEPIHYRIFENLTNDESIAIEIDLIKYFGRLDNKTGILSNATDGGDGANNFSKETLKKVGQPKKKIYQYNLDGSFVKEWESMGSIDLTKHTGNLSSAIKRNGSFMGFLWSHEYTEKMTPKIKYQMPNKYLNISQIDIKTGETIKIFNNALDIEKELKLRQGARNKIYECLKNKNKTAYGYKWQESS